MSDIKLSTLIEQETGWRGESERIAMAVVMGESGGNETAVNGEFVGLMQMGSRIHAGKYGIPAGPGGNIAESARWLSHGRNNVRAAYKLYIASGGWGPWEAYTKKNAPYLAQYNSNRDPIIHLREGEGIGGTVHEATAGAADAASGVVESVPGVSELLGVANFLKALADPSTWLRFGKGFLGGILLLTGAAALVFVVANKAQNTPAVQTGAKLATKVIK